MASLIHVAIIHVAIIHVAIIHVVIIRVAIIHVAIIHVAIIHVVVSLMSSVLSWFYEIRVNYVRLERIESVNHFCIASSMKIYQCGHIVAYCFVYGCIYNSKYATSIR